MRISKKLFRGHFENQYPYRTCQAAMAAVQENRESAFPARWREVRKAVKVRAMENRLFG